MGKFYLPRADRMPAGLIIGVDNHLINLKRALAQPELPTVDLDALLGFVVDALRHEPTADYELNALPHTLMRYEALGARVDPNRMWDLEDPWDNLFGLEIVLDHAVRMGHVLRQAIKWNGLLEGDLFKFDYDGVLDDRSIIFRRMGG